MRDFPVRYFIWTLLAVFAVGAGQVWAALQPPPTEAMLVQSPEYSAKHPHGELPTAAYFASMMKDGSRAPASVEPAESVGGKLAAAIGKDIGVGVRKGPADASAALMLNEAAELTLTCKGSLASNFPNNITQLRLFGEACGRKDLSSVTVENVTNGFSATVFTQPPRSYSTDYLSLARGENRIKIALAYANGTTENRELTITHTK